MKAGKVTAKARNTINPVKSAGDFSGQDPEKNSGPINYNFSKQSQPSD